MVQDDEAVLHLVAWALLHHGQERLLHGTKTMVFYPFHGIETLLAIHLLNLETHCHQINPQLEKYQFVILAIGDIILLINVVISMITLKKIKECKKLTLSTRKKKLISLPIQVLLHI